MVDTFDKKPSPDKPEVAAEETVVHAGVGHQAILVCQVVLMLKSMILLLMLLMSLLLIDILDVLAGHQAILVCQVVFMFV